MVTSARGGRVILRTSTRRLCAAASPDEPGLPALSQPTLFPVIFSVSENLYRSETFTPQEARYFHGAIAR